MRQLEDLRAETEERYFVYRGRVFANQDEPPEFVKTIASRIDSPFFAVDVVLNAVGNPRLIELGDGQVSDRKKWSVSRFIDIFREAPG